MKKQDIRDVLVQSAVERAGRLCEQWRFYQEVRERIRRELEALTAGPEARERLDTALSDLEICAAVAAYHLGAQDAWRLARELDREDFAPRALELFRPD